MGIPRHAAAWIAQTLITFEFQYSNKKKKRKLITVKKKIHPDSIHNTKCKDFLTVSTTYVPLYQLIIEWHHCPRWLG